MRLHQKIYYLLIFTCFGGIIACTDSKTKPINPNGDSELALLMRDLHEDGLRLKQQILDGKAPDIKAAYEKLLVAKATEPAKAASPEYAAFTSFYEASVASLLEAQEGHRAEAYQSMVNACMACHQELCPGPMVKIKRLYLSEKEMSSLNTIQE